MSAKGQEIQTVFPSEKPKGTRKGFVRIDNDLAQDKRLSFGCRGMLLHVLSKPKHFRHSARGLSFQGAEGEHTLEGYIREAIQLGYCKRAKNRTTKGHIESSLTFYETPQPTAENWLSAPTATLPAVGSPTSRSTDCRLDGGLCNDPPRNDRLRNKNKKETNVCVGAEPPPPTHTPSFLSVVQSDFPDKDVPAIWQKMIAEYATKPHRHTEAKLREWCAREFATQNAVAFGGPPQVVQSLKTKPDLFTCSKAFVEYANSYRDGTPKWEDVPDSIRIKIVEELHPEISGPPEWRIEAASKYPDKETALSSMFWRDYPDGEHKREMLKKWRFSKDAKAWWGIDSKGRWIDPKYLTF